MQRENPRLRKMRLVLPSRAAIATRATGGDRHAKECADFPADRPIGMALAEKVQEGACSRIVLIFPFWQYFSRSLRSVVQRGQNVQADGIYACVNCQAYPLRHFGDRFACSACGAIYPIQFDVPILLKDARTEPSDVALTSEFAKAICECVSLPATEANIDRLKQIFSFNHHLPDLHMAAENNYFFQRIPLPAEFQKQRAAKPVSSAINVDVRYAIVGHLVPDALPAGTTLTRNVRLHNSGSSIISSKANPPVCVSYHWRSPTGEVVIHDGERSPLPIDLPPGWTISLPTVIRTPPAPGPYMLELCLVHEGREWLEADAFAVGVEVFPAGTGSRLPQHWVSVRNNPAPYNYGEDHEEARRMVLDQIARHQRPGYRILEVGGCCNPMTRGADAEIYSIDVDIQTLQVGRLSVRDPAERLEFVAADVHRLPFVPHSFDCVAIFSALHHFPRPLDALRDLKRLLKHDGFMAIMCEPVGDYRNGVVSAEFVKELERGISEQIFSAEEYNHMFLRAGLYTSMVTMDRGSFKAFAHAERDSIISSRRNRRRDPLAEASVEAFATRGGIKLLSRSSIVALRGCLPFRDFRQSAAIRDVARTSPRGRSTTYLGLHRV